MRDDKIPSTPIGNDWSAVANNVTIAPIICWKQIARPGVVATASKRFPDCSTRLTGYEDSHLISFRGGMLASMRLRWRICRSSMRRLRDPSKVSANHRTMMQGMAMMHQKMALMARVRRVMRSFRAWLDKRRLESRPRVSISISDAVSMETLNGLPNGLVATCISPSSEVDALIGTVHAL